MQKAPNNVVQAQALMLINRWNWFSFLSNEAKSWFAERCQLQTIDKGRDLYMHNDPVSHIHGLMSGSLKIYTTSAAGEEVTLEDVAIGAWFPHFIHQEKPTYFGNCTATKTSTLLSISLKDFVACGEKWPELFRGLYVEFSARAAATIGRIELLTQHSLKVRLAVYLLRLLVVRGSSDESNGYFVESSDSQKEIANRVGGARQRVNAILKEFERIGAISFATGGLFIVNPYELLSIAKESGFDVDTYLEAWQGGWKSPFYQGSGFKK